MHQHNYNNINVSEAYFLVPKVRNVHEQSHIIAHSQGLTNGLSDRDYRVLTISLFYVQNKYITTWNIKTDLK